MRKILALFYILFAYYSVLGQSFDPAKSYISKINLLNKAAEGNRYHDLNKLLSYSTQAKVLAEQVNYKPGLAKALYNMGTYYASVKNDEKAIQNYKLSLKLIRRDDFTLRVQLLKSLGESQAHDEKKLSYLTAALELAKKKRSNLLAEIYRSTGDVYYQSGNYGKAFSQYIDGLQNAEKLQDSVAIITNTSGIQHVLETERCVNALAVNERALQMAELGNKNILIAMVKCSRSTEFRRRGILDSALIIALDALKIAEKAGAPFVASGCLSEIGYIHQLKNQNQKAIDYYNQALKSLDPAKITDVHITNLVRLGEVYQRLGEINKSVYYLKEAVKKAEIIKSNENLKDAYQKLSDIYFKSSKYKEAYQFLEKYHNVKDSIFNLENAQIIASVQTNYLADKREKAIELLNQKNEIKDLQLAKNQNKILFLAALFLVILGIALFLYYRYRMKAKAHILMESSNREKDLLLQEVHHRIKNNLQLISTLLDWQFENIYEEKMLRILEEGKSRIGSIALIHEMLYQSKDFKSIDLKEYFDDLLYRIEGSYKDRNIVILKNIDSVTLEVDIIIPIGLIITELVTNSLKYAFPFDQAGVMEITLTRGIGNTCFLKIIDNGIGIPEELTRKNSTNTMGLELVKTLVRQIKGKLEIYNDNGANFVISFSSIKTHKIPIKSNDGKYECINS